jgi:hypothetical protein
MLVVLSHPDLVDLAGAQVRIAASKRALASGSGANGLMIGTSMPDCPIRLDPRTALFRCARDAGRVYHRVTHRLLGRLPIAARPCLGDRSGLGSEAVLGHQLVVAGEKPGIEGKAGAQRGECGSARFGDRRWQQRGDLDPAGVASGKARGLGQLRPDRRGRIDRTARQDDAVGDLAAERDPFREHGR